MGKILVTRSSMPEFEEYVNEIRELWDTHWITNMGIKHVKLQENLTDYLGVEQVELFTNGHMALELTLQAMKLKGEVITTPFTFASTTHAIIRNGLKPVFADINPYDFTIDVERIEELITDKTCAIVPVHVYGNVCDVEAIDRIANIYGLKVIYDAAHAFGEAYKDIGIGNFGDASCFSFHATKVFNTIEGGAVSYNDKEFGLDLYRLKNFGIRGPECVDAVGANAKMNEFCAAMGICNLRHIAEEIEKRKKVVTRYRERLEGEKGLQLNPIQVDVKPNYSYFPVIFHEEFGVDRDAVFSALENAGVGARKYFYPIASEYDCYKDEYNSSYTPIALDISKKVLTLPMYADLSLEDVDNICDVIINCKK